MLEKVTLSQNSWVYGLLIEQHQKLRHHPCHKYWTPHFRLHRIPNYDWFSLNWPTPSAELQRSLWGQALIFPHLKEPRQWGGRGVFLPINSYVLPSCPLSLPPLVLITFLNIRMTKVEAMLCNKRYLLWLKLFPEDMTQYIQGAPDPESKCTSTFAFAIKTDGCHIT